MLLIQGQESQVGQGQEALGSQGQDQAASAVIQGKELDPQEALARLLMWILS